MTTDLIVVGAGVVGATLAMEASRRGLSTVLLDAADDVGGGCSYANAALLAPSHVAPLATPAALRDATRQLFRRPPALLVHPDPTVLPWLGRLAASAWSRRVRAAAPELRALAEASAARHVYWYEEGLSSTYRRIGAVDVRFGRGGPLSPARLRELEPALGVVASGIHHPDEAITESRTYIREMIAAARASGAVIEFGQRVLGVERSGDRATGVRLDRGVLRAEQVVVCTGLDAGELAADVGIRLPLRGGRGYVIDLEPSADTPRMAVRFPEHRVVVTPLADRVRVAGSMEFGAEGRPWDTRRAHRLVAVAARGLPALATRPVMDLWAGERPCAPDGLPVIGPTATVGGLSFAVGHGMWGLVLAPITAELILQGLTDGPDPAGLFSPDRFTSTAWWRNTARASVRRQVTPGAPARLR